MADIEVANTDSDLSGNTLVTEENAYTITGLHTFSRSTNAPFACVSGAAVVAYLDADKLDGIEATGFIKANGTVALSANWDAGGYEIRSNTFESDVATGTIPLVIASTTKCTNLNADKLDDQEGTYYLAAANVTGTLAVGKGGTGATSLTDGGVLLGSGTSAITATAVLGDGVILIGDASGDPTTLDVGSSTAITVLGTVATGTWQATDVGVAYGGTGVSTLTDGGVLLGSGSSAITAMAVLTDGQMIVGDGTGDPVAESGATLRTSVGVGTGDSPQFTGLTVSGTGASSLDVGGGLNIGTGDVALIGTDGKINGPLSSTIIDDLSGANLTTLAAGNISSGTVATARLGSGTASSATFLRGDQSWATPGAASATVLSKTANYTVTTGDAGTNATIKCDPAGGAFTITLYAASGNSGRRIKVIKTTSNALAVLVDGNGSETINGIAGQYVYGQWDYLSLICDGSNWVVEDSLISIDAQAYLSSDQTVVSATDTVIICQTENWDVASTYNTSTGVFTVPTGGAGYYEVNAMCQGDGTNDTSCLTMIFDGGTEVARNQDQKNPSNSSLGVLKILSLSAGDTVSMKYLHTRGSDTTVVGAQKQTWFGVRMLSLTWA
jgi:hypothetical protein